MDEFKYRVWDFVNKKMLPVCLIRRNADGSITVNATDNIDCWNPIQVSGKHKNGELLRYIGLKDKNGKEIYEGDIITYYGYSAYGRDKTKTIECIKWNDSACGFDLSYITIIDNGDIGLGCIDIEVIGNKYQNPELLKGGDK